MSDLEETTILVIDDERAIRESFGDFLEDRGFRVLLAENGRAGLALFEQERPDLVLVDLRMPEMDGLAVLGRIRDRSPETPLIVVSGAGVLADAVEALHRGAWDYLLKPVSDFSILSHAVESALEKVRLKRENQAYQEHLERLVADRTEALTEANARLRRINVRLRHIVETTRSLAFCAEVEQFAATLLEEFGRHMQAVGGSIYLKEKDVLRLRHTLDPGHAPEVVPMPPPEGSVFAEALAVKEPVLIEDITALPGIVASGWDGYRDGSVLVFPLPDERGDIAGILTLHGKAEPPFVDQDKEIGTILASYSCEALRAVRAAARLRESEARLRSILDAIRVGVLVVGADDLKICYLNPTAAEMIGAPVSELVGAPCRKVLCVEKDSRCPVVHEGASLDSVEDILKTVDGREIPVLRTVAKTVIQGRECLLESVIDLTLQKRAEKEKHQLLEQLRQTQKMEALGTLAGGITHDFNNLLSGILGYAQLGMLDAEGAARDRFESIHRAGERARDLVGRILAFSRSGEQLRRPVEIAAIVKETLKLLESSVPADITIQSDIRSDRRVMGDPTQLHQLVMNLCTNAYQAMQTDGGVLRVTLAPTRVDAGDPLLELPPGDYVRLVVSDTGAGIPEAIRERIFDPYFTTKEKGKGTGLGLAVVHGIVASHKGAVIAESRDGGGTRFVVQLPTTDEAETEDAALADLPTGREHILLVDDESDLVAIGRQMLTRLGYRVTVAESSREALACYARSPEAFDLVITDLDMPHMSGDRLFAEMVRLRPDQSAILCTGFSDRLDQARARQLGIRRFLMKPLSLEMLARVVREVLDG